MHFIFLVLIVLNLVARFTAPGTLMAVGMLMLPAASACFWARQFWSASLVSSNHRPALRVVTLYRCLEALVKASLVERIATSDGSTLYASAEKARHAHPHFYCSDCKAMECLQADLVEIDMQTNKDRVPGIVKKVDIRIDGICDKCRAKREGASREDESTRSNRRKRNQT
jgi:Fe2+ or Zn2+ uptake regulation protein